MIRAAFHRIGGKIASYEISGHSGYAPEGSDIVCAAVSALAQSTLIGLTEVLNLTVRSSRDDKTGYLSVKLPSAALEPAWALMETLLKALESIGHAYPGYLRVTCEEGRQHHV